MHVLMYVHSITSLGSTVDPTDPKSLFEVCVKEYGKHGEVSYSISGGRLSAMRNPRSGTEETYELAKSAFESFKSNYERAKK
jgi:hypothetical protein